MLVINILKINIQSNNSKLWITYQQELNRDISKWDNYLYYAYDQYYKYRKQNCGYQSRLNRCCILPCR